MTELRGRRLEAALLRLAARGQPGVVVDPLRDALLREYAEVCQNIRTLTDIRFRLIALLPVGTLAAAFFGLEAKGAGTVAIAAVGLAATLGLFVYSERNDQLYDDLIGRAAQLERRLGLPGGAYANRPRPWLRLALPGWFGSHTIDHGTGIRLVYASAFVAWLFAALFALAAALVPAGAATLRAALAVALLIAVAVAVRWGLGWYDSARSAAHRDLRKAGRMAIDAALALSGEDMARRDGERWQTFVAACRLLAGPDTDVPARASAYLAGGDWARSFGAPAPGDAPLAPPAAAQLVALLVDLSPRWLLDNWRGRRA